MGRPLAEDGSSGSPTGRGTIAVLTFRRPDELERLVPLLFEQIQASGLPFSVLVVDNDPDGSAEPVLNELARTGLRWVNEKTPGIAAARNRALDESLDDDLLVFIDDDETPHDGWLQRLVETQAATGAAGVVGAVISEFTGELDPWIRDGDFFTRPRQPTGTRVGLAATNNLLLDLRFVRREGLRFDERFGISGGSDSVFTRALVARGGELVWCDEAVVTDVVPSQRMTRKWVIRRWFRMGNTWSRAAVTVDGERGPTAVLRIKLVLGGAARVVAGGLQALGGTMGRSRARQANGCRVAARGAGMILGASGYHYAEYRRR
jgi:glycosyltransferase involved in cell wall biosynthesis